MCNILYFYNNTYFLFFGIPKVSGSSLSVFLIVTNPQNMSNIFIENNLHISEPSSQFKPIQGSTIIMNA